MSGIRGCGWFRVVPSQRRSTRSQVAEIFGDESRSRPNKSKSQASRPRAVSSSESEGERSRKVSQGRSSRSQATSSSRQGSSKKDSSRRGQREPDEVMFISQPSSSSKAQPKKRQSKYVEPQTISSESENEAESEAVSDGTESDEADEQSAASLLPKFILTGLMKYGVRDIQQMTKLIQSSCRHLKLPFRPEYSKVEGIKPLILQINESIARFQMEGKLTKCEFTGKQYIVFCMQKEVPILKLQATFKKGEVESIQNCINAMLSINENFSLSLMDCIQEVQKANTKMNDFDARQFIERIIDKFYFAKNNSIAYEDRSNYYVTLGFRAIEELSSIIQDKHEGLIRTCGLCLKSLLHAFKCPNPTCDVLVHKYCAAAFLESPQKCKRCKVSWDNLGSMIERTATNAGN